MQFEPVTRRICRLEGHVSVARATDANGTAARDTGGMFKVVRIRLPDWRVDDMVTAIGIPSDAWLERIPLTCN